MATEIKPQRTSVARESSIGLGRQGLAPRGDVHWNLIAPELFKDAARRDEGEFADMGPFVAITAPHTGRSPDDKFVVKELIELVREALPQGQVETSVNVSPVT